MKTLSFFYVAFFAEIARAGTQPERLPGSAKKDISLQVSRYRFNICFWFAVYKYCPRVRIENLAHLFRWRREWGANQALPVTPATILALQAHPGCGFNLFAGDDAYLYNARPLLGRIT
jgi:hypothetical protein